MDVPIGQIVYEQILSVNSDNNVVTGATFSSSMYRDNQLYTAVTIAISITDYSTGIYTATWSSSTTGSFQMYLKNNTTNVIYVSDIVNVRNSSFFEQNIYVGL